MKQHFPYGAAILLLVLSLPFFAAQDAGAASRRYISFGTGGVCQHHQ